MAIVYKRVEIDKNMSKDHRTTQYSTKQKLEAVVLYRMTGSLANTAAHLGIPADTVQRWHVSDWWKVMEEDIRVESRAKLSGKLQNIVDKSFKVVEERLDRGDWIYDQKQGKLLRKPVGAQVANQILRDSLDKTFFIEKLARTEKQVETEEKVTERLLRLSEEFQRYNKAKEITQNAVHDQREAGLREGESALQIETSPSEAPGSTEPSSGTHDESRAGS